MDKNVIESFWRHRAEEGQGRWTEQAMLDFELSVLQPYANAKSAILDLGSGVGTLSRELLKGAGSLTLVEKQSGFLESVPDTPGLTKTCCDLEEFVYTSHYDLILLFGVVTHLEKANEQSVYASAAAHLAPGGVFAVKNQVTPGPELIVDRQSEQLGCRYVGRYPNQDEQRAELARLFHKVEVVPYPRQFNKWSDTAHMLFLCSDPLAAH